MTVEEIIAYCYLSISLLSFVIHARAAFRLHKAKTWHALVRTTTWRVVCSVLYVGVGVNAVFWQWATAEVAIGVYTVTAGIWIINSMVDRRLGAPKHRRRRFITFTLGWQENPQRPAPGPKGKMP